MTMKSLFTLVVIAAMSLGMRGAAVDAAPINKSAKRTSKRANQPNVTGMESATYHCELGKKVTIYRNAEDNNAIVLRWNKRLYRMVRIETSTGADRFENEKNGMVWIGIPAKGILLDSRNGRQLANECKTALAS